MRKKNGKRSFVDDGDEIPTRPKQRIGVPESGGDVEDSQEVKTTSRESDANDSGENRKQKRESRKSRRHTKEKEQQEGSKKKNNKKKNQGIAAEEHSHDSPKAKKKTGGKDDNERRSAKGKIKEKAELAGTTGGGNQKTRVDKDEELKAQLKQERKSNEKEKQDGKMPASTLRRRELDNEESHYSSFSSTASDRPGAYQVNSADIERGERPTTPRPPTPTPPVPLSLPNPALTSKGGSPMVVAELAPDIDEVVSEALRQHRESVTNQKIAEAKVVTEKKICGVSRPIFYVILTVVIAILVVAIVLGVVLPSDTEEPTPTETTPPLPTPPPITSPPTPSSTPKITSARYSEVADILFPILGVTELLEGSNEFKAMEWIVDDDPASLSIQTTPTQQLVERFVLALLYFATSGSDWVDDDDWIGIRPVCMCSMVTCVDDEVQELHMRENNLVGSIPSEIGLLTNLDVITIWGNQLVGTLPTTIGELSGLEMFDCSDNYLSGPIPTEIAALEEVSLFYPRPSMIGILLTVLLAILCRLDFIPCFARKYVLWHYSNCDHCLDELGNTCAIRE